MIFSYHTGLFEVYSEFEKRIRSVPGPLADGYIFTLSAPTEGPMSIPMTSKYRHVPYYKWNLLHPDFNYLSYGSGNERITYRWSFEYGSGKEPVCEEIVGKILEVMRSIPPWTLPGNKSKSP